MKVFVTGVAGQLGHDVMNDLAARGYEGIGTDIAPQYSGADDGTAVTKMPYVSLDITDRDAVEKTITELKPDVVVHCAAWTAVDLAEDDDKKAKVHAINADGTQNIADACKKIDAKMVYISTDYVFDGQGEKAWEPDCKDYKPLNVYGETKLAGELAVQQLCLCFPEIGLRQVFPEQRGAGTADGGVYTDHLFHGGLCDQPPRFCGQKADLYGISAQYVHLGWFGGAVSSVYSHEPAGTDQEYGGSGTDAYRRPGG